MDASPMRRLLRIFYNATAILFLLLALALAALAVRSYWICDYVGYGSTSFARYGIRSSTGEVVVWWWTQQLPWDGRSGWISLPERTRMDVARWQGIPTSPDRPRGLRVGYLRFGNTGRRYDTDYRYLLLPLWPLAAGFALLPAWLIVRLYRRRARPGLCPACSYDLRATPDRCPECGTVPTK